MRIHRLGRAGERAAALYLEARGWTVLDRNYRDGPRELDLVATRSGVLAFVEVKTRTGPAADPMDPSALGSISPRKRADLRRAARAWLVQAGRSRREGRNWWEIRFDAVVVRVGPDGHADIEHLPDAWWGSW